MDTHDMLSNVIEAKERELAALYARAERLANLPTEPKEGAVVTWRHVYHPGSQSYTFAAVRTPQGWVMTGKDSRARTWSQLLDFVQSSAQQVSLRRCGRGQKLELPE